VVFTADSDGKVSAARRPVVGADKVARLLIGLMSRVGTEYRVLPSSYNGAPAVLVYRDDAPDSVFTIEMAGGRITDFYVIRNPEKLASATVVRQISR
jgi:RNA polymerase sigma-70 factor (ECF subfamily)